MKWWSPPKQRQLWGEAHILPSDNWGQIFFDLFYVGGAYNLGNVIKTSDQDFRCILYFCAAGFPSMMMWYDKLYFDARFTTRPGHDIFHRSIEILQLCCVATALSRIRSVEILSHPCNHSDAFQFSISLFLNSLLTICRYVEVVKYVIGDSAAHIVARRDIMFRIIPTLFLFAATIDSGVSFYGRDGDEYAMNERPICFLLASWMSWVIIGYCDQVFFTLKQQCIETSVPLNVHFCMHRYGEWFMLMFGESIMSLLIVEGDNESFNHSVKFYCGVLSVIFLAHLHFQSEPHHNSDHAVTRSRHSNYLYTVLVPIYSMALIATGICYKMFLYDYQKGDNRRALGDSNQEAGYGDTEYQYIEKKQQFTADLFSGSIATVLICTDLNALLHHGTQSILCQLKTIPKTRLALLTISKYSLVFFLATMSAFQNDPHFMAPFGLGAILFQEYLHRSFKSWQQYPETIHNADDSSTDSDGTLRTCFTGYSADEDYQYEIESFADAKMALAKFERRLIVETKPTARSRKKDTEKICEKVLPQTYYAC